MHRGVHTHVPLLARTWFLPTAVPLLHTECREARTPAHSRPHHSHTGSHTRSHTGSLSYTEAHSGSHTGSHPYLGAHPYSGFLAHKGSHLHTVPCYSHPRSLPPAVPLSHTACREARTPAHSRPHHSHTGDHPHTEAHPHSGAHLHTGLHSYTELLPHTGMHSGSQSYSRPLAHNAFPALLHSRHVCVAARISTRW